MSLLAETRPLLGLWKTAAEGRSLYNDIDDVVQSMADPISMCNDLGIYQVVVVVVGVSESENRTEQSTGQTIVALCIVTRHELKSPLYPRIQSEQCLDRVSLVAPGPR